MTGPAKLENKSILIIGGTGFIGSRLIEKLILQHDVEIKVLLRRYERAVRISRYPVKLIQGDAASESIVRESAAGCDYVVDCSYVAQGDTKERCEESIALANAVSAGSLSAGVQRVIHLSSISVYGETGVRDLTEETEYAPSKDAYSLAKRASEKAILQQYTDHQLPVVVLQPTVIYGPYAGWTNGPLQQLKTGQIALVNGGDGACNAVYIDDVVDSILLALQTPGVNGQKFLVSGPEPVTWKQYIDAHVNMLELDANATTNKTTQEIEAVFKQRHKEAKAGRMLLTELRQNASLRQMVLRLPVLAQTLAFSKKLLKDDSFEKVKEVSLGAEAYAASPVANSQQTVHYPSPSQLELFASKTKVQINRAQNQLGYRPQYDLVKGMALTAEWARWARLL